MAPATVIPDKESPENPLSTPELLTVNVVPAEDEKVSVPVPDKVPLRVNARLLPTPFTTVGLFPSGNVQLLPIVPPPLPDQFMVTRLKV